MTAWAGPLEEPERYELLGVRSRGGEGQVWQAILFVDGVPIDVAVKVVNPQSIPDLDTWRVRWQRQAELLRSVDHPGLVKVREVFEGPLPHVQGAADLSSKTLYLVMNWAWGENLEEWVSARPQRRFEDAMAVLGSVADAVDYLHGGPVGGRTLVHRDIKPANIVIHGDQARLVDFGFARIVGGSSQTFAGTPSYMPPEVLAGGEHDAAADRFGLGATAYYALTGDTPKMNDYVGMLHRVQATPGLEGRPQVANRFLTMLHPDPSQRPGSAVAWLDSLCGDEAAPTVTRSRVGSVTAGGGSSGGQVPGPHGAHDKPDRRKAVLVATIAALALVGVVLAVLLVSGEDEKSRLAVGQPVPSTSTTIRGRMPDLIGVPESVARSLLRDQGLTDDKVMVVSGASSRPRGVVTEQSPPAGNPVGNAARLTVSEGPGQARTDGPRITTTRPAVTTTSVPPKLYMSQIEPVSGSPDREAATIDGRYSERSVVMYICESCSKRERTVEYSLGRHYRTFNARVAMDDKNEDASARTVFELQSVDSGAVLWSSDRHDLNGVVSGGSVSTGDVDVANVLRIRLIARPAGPEDYGYAVWGDAFVSV